MATTTSRSKAAYLGVFIGDSASMRLDARATKTKRDVDNAMLLEGGGFGTGQFVYSGQLSMVLSSVLARFDPKNREYPTEEVAHAYKQWFMNRAHHELVDRETYRAFSVQWSASIGSSLGGMMQLHAGIQSMKATTNGALMRAVPIAIWAQNMSDEDIANFAREDARLTHPNIICQTINAVYCIAVAHLIRTSGDIVGMLTRTSNFIMRMGTPEVYSWIKRAICMDKAPVCPVGEEKEVKWTFMSAMWHIIHESTFDDAMRNALFHCTHGTPVVCGIVGASKGMLEMEESVWEIDQNSIHGINEALVKTITEAQLYYQPVALSNNAIVPRFDALMNRALV